ASLTSRSAGSSRSIRPRAASVGATLRVVRLNSRTCSRASSRRIASLTWDGLVPRAFAPSRKPPARATAMNTTRSSRSALIVRNSGQYVQIVLIMRKAHLLFVPTRSHTMSILDTSGTFRLGDRMVKRVGYGAMQLAGKGVFGPPRDLDAAIAVLRAALEAGVDHIDTSDFYGPHVTNRLI